VPTLANMVITQPPLTTRRTSSRIWIRVAFAMFAVGWGANQFSPMLIVYRHELNIGAGVVAGLFGIYAAALLPGLLIGGPASDRYGRRPVVLPFVALSPLATGALVLWPRDLAALAAGRALAGLCSGVVFSSATAWVQELSPGTGLGPRRAALALTAGFGFGPIVSSVLAQWAPDPLRVPYLPHLVLGAAAAVLAFRTPGTAPARVPRLRWPPSAVRTAQFWLRVAPNAPLVFGTLALAIVVLPEDVTSARTLSAGFAGLMTALMFASGTGVQPLARRLTVAAGSVAGPLCAAAGAAVGAAAMHAGNAGHVLAGAAAVLLGLGYGLCLVTGLRQAEQLADPQSRGAVVACYYALAYVGFAVPYLAAGLGAAVGQATALAILAGAALILTAWSGLAAVRRG
jgi:MFS family permease